MNGEEPRRESLVIELVRVAGITTSTYFPPTGVYTALRDSGRGTFMIERLEDKGWRWSELNVDGEELTSGTIEYMDVLLARVGRWATYG